MPHSTAASFKQAQEFADTTYSTSLGLLASLERVLDTLPKGSELGSATAALLERAQQVNRAIAALRLDLAELRNQTAEP